MSICVHNTILNVFRVAELIIMSDLLLIHILTRQLTCIFTIMFTIFTINSRGYRIGERVDMIK